MPQVSIVVPVYKVEKYLLRCVKSLRCQTLKDIEIILVDDGSPDNCGKMCDEFAEEDSRIKVVHKKNGGLSSARNAGMRVATGEYIGFVDSDDAIVESMYEKMTDIIKEYHCNFVMSDYIRVFNDGSSNIKSLDLDKGIYDKQKIERIVYPQLVMGSNIDYGPLLSVWHCLYDMNFLKRNNIQFDEEVRWSEDNIFSAMVGYYAESFYYMKGEGLYYYFQNPGTITTSFKRGAWDVYKTMNYHLKSFFDKNEEKRFDMQLKYHFIYYACNCIGQTISLPEKEQKQEIISILNDLEKENIFDGLDTKNINNKLKIQLLLMRKKWVRLLMFLVARRK